MIYREPRFLPGGDRYVLIEFGDEMNLELNFTAQGLAGVEAAVRRSRGLDINAACGQLKVEMERKRRAVRA